MSKKSRREMMLKIMDFLDRPESALWFSVLSLVTSITALLVRLLR